MKKIFLTVYLAVSAYSMNPVEEKLGLTFFVKDNQFQCNQGHRSTWKDMEVIKQNIEEKRKKATEALNMLHSKDQNYTCKCRTNCSTTRDELIQEWSKKFKKSNDDLTCLEAFLLRAQAVVSKPS